MKWSDKQDADLRKWFGGGLSAGQIAEVMGITRNSVCGRKFRLGICDPDGCPRPFSDDDMATIIAMRQNKITHARIAKVLGRTEASIAIKAGKMGLTRHYGASA